VVATGELNADTVLLEAETNQSEIRIAMAARTRVRGNHGGSITDRTLIQPTPAYVGHEFGLLIEAGVPVTVEKVVAVSTSRDRAISTPALAVTARIGRAGSFGQLLDAHSEVWACLWDRFGVTVEDGARVGLALTLNSFHVLQTLSSAAVDVDAGVPARGLHGEAYRGHVFWDEVFIYPMLTLRAPELTRDLLRYRYRRLGAARAAARANRHRGAMFPWQSGSDGREETPAQLWNPRSGRWMADNSRRQRHVGLAIAYATWKYYDATGDVLFLIDHGAELIVEVARFFASLAVHGPGDDRYDICGVMGPDEFHDGYPDAPGAGLRNNAYTNVLAAWVLQRAAETVALLRGHDCGELWPRLALRRGEPKIWRRIGHRLRVPFHDGVISQFEGYEHLAEFDWAGYRARYGDIGRLDLILEAEGDTTNHYRLSKQADVLMLFYLFSADELRAILHSLDYAFPPEAIPRTVDYYTARTSHGSTLSRLVHAWVLARGDRHRSWSLFTATVESDLADIQGGTTREGIHLGAMAGSVDLAVRCYGGIETRGNALWLNPAVPPELRGL
jgi:trehalose/maltose hydrolase-like predicted phosphorylase